MIQDRGPRRQRSIALRAWLGATRMRARAAEDEGSMSMALLVVLATSVLSAAVFPVVVAHLRSTRVDMRHVSALTAAEAGVQAGLAQLRSAQDSLGAGSVSLLPCGVLTGTPSAASSQAYTVTVSYYAYDPTGQSVAWLSSNALSCATGSGPSAIPSFAFLSATGTDGTDSVGAESVTATYRFNRGTDTGAGGLIRANPLLPSGTQYCLDAGQNLAVGYPLTLQLCVAINQQRFFYTSNLTLTLPATMSSTYPFGLCVQAAIPHFAGESVTLAACADPIVPAQQFSYGSDGQFHSSGDGLLLDGLCLQAPLAQLTGLFELMPCLLPTMSFAPDLSAGVGAAGTPRQELTNGGQYSRCLNVPAANTASQYLTIAPCAQPFAAGGTPASQTWVLPSASSDPRTASGAITTTLGGSTLCLTSHGVGQYPTTDPCQGGSPDQQWSVTGNSPVSAADYRVTDSSGGCLSETDPGALPPDLEPVSGSSKAVLTACVADTTAGAGLQQWNAPATVGMNRLQSLTQH